MILSSALSSLDSFLAAGSVGGTAISVGGTAISVGGAAGAMSDPRSAWAPIVLMIIIGVGFAVGNVVLSLLIGPRRTGPGKEATYESGMVPVGDTRKRFNVRFYIVAMIFLVIDVDIIFFYPWATIFPHYIQNPPSPGVPQLLLIEILIFVAILLVAYVYAWGKGVFRWD